MSTYQLVIVLIFIVAVLYVLWRRIPWRKIYGDNPRNACVYVEYGEKSDPVKGTYYCVTSNSVTYRYKWTNTWFLVRCPSDYPWRFVSTNGRRKVRAYPGKLDALPLEATVDPEKLEAGAKEAYAFLESRVHVQIAESVKSKVHFSIMTVIIILAVVVAGVMFYQDYQEKEAQRKLQDNTPAKVEKAAPVKPANIEDLIKEDLER